MTPSGRSAPAQITIGLTPSQLHIERQLHLKRVLDMSTTTHILEPWEAAEAEGRRVWLAEQVELLASGVYPPRSPAVASHAPVTMLTTLCSLLPRSIGPATSSGCWSFCCCRDSQRTGRRNVRRLAAAATAGHRHPTGHWNLRCRRS